MIDRRLAVTDLFFTARVAEAPAPADAYSYVSTPLSSVNRAQCLWNKKESAAWWIEMNNGWGAALAANSLYPKTETILLLQTKKQYEAIRLLKENRKKNG